MRVSAELEDAGSIECALAMMLGFLKDNTMAPMELVRLHVRCASLYKLYTEVTPPSEAPSPFKRLDAPIHMF